MNATTRSPKKRFFGKKSEQLDAAQLQLLLNGLAQGADEPAPQISTLPVVAALRRSRANSQRLRTPDNLEVVREVIEPQLVVSEPEAWKPAAGHCARARPRRRARSGRAWIAGAHAGQ